jgi:hypothetical protein
LIEEENEVEGGEEEFVGIVVVESRARRWPESYGQPSKGHERKSQGESERGRERSTYETSHHPDRYFEDLDPRIDIKVDVSDRLFDSLFEACFVVQHLSFRERAEQ